MNSGWIGFNKGKVMCHPIVFLELLLFVYLVDKLSSRLSDLNFAREGSGWLTMKNIQIFTQYQL